MAQSWIWPSPGYGLVLYMAQSWKVKIGLFIPHDWKLPLALYNLPYHCLVSIVNVSEKKSSIFPHFMINFSFLFKISKFWFSYKCSFLYLSLFHIQLSIFNILWSVVSPSFPTIYFPLFFIQELAPGVGPAIIDNIEQNVRHGKIAPCVFLSYTNQSTQIDCPYLSPKSAFSQTFQFGFQDDANIAVCRENQREFFQCTLYYM